MQAKNEERQQESVVIVTTLTIEEQASWRELVHAEHEGSMIWARWTLPKEDEDQDAKLECVWSPTNHWNLTSFRYITGGNVPAGLLQALKSKEHPYAYKMGFALDIKPGGLLLCHAMTISTIYDIPMLVLVSQPLVVLYTEADATQKEKIGVLGLLTPHGDDSSIIMNVMPTGRILKLDEEYKHEPKLEDWLVQQIEQKEDKSLKSAVAQQKRKRKQDIEEARKRVKVLEEECDLETVCRLTAAARARWHLRILQSSRN